MHLHDINCSNQIELILSSFYRITGKHLVDPLLPKDDQYRELHNADFCVVSHNTESDPVFNYGNQAALNLFEMSWDDFTRLPSRLSAEPQTREEREKLLSAVTEKGYVEDYRGVRVSSTGRRFMVENAIVWNLIDGDGQYNGQAAVLYQWSNV
jgi:hypothetical protein